MPAILFKLDRGLLIRIDHEVSLAPPGPVTRLGSIRDLLREALDARARSRGEPVFAPRAVSPPEPKPAKKPKAEKKPAPKKIEKWTAGDLALVSKALDVVMDAVEASPPLQPQPVRRAPASGHVRRIGVSATRKKGTP